MAGFEARLAAVFAALVRHLIYQYLLCVEQSAMTSQADKVILYSESHNLPSTMHQLEFSRHWSLTVCPPFGGDWLRGYLLPCCFSDASFCPCDDSITVAPRSAE